MIYLSFDILSNSYVAFVNFVLETIKLRTLFHISITGISTYDNIIVRKVLIGFPEFIHLLFLNNNLRLSDKTMIHLSISRLEEDRSWAGCASQDDST